MFDRVFEPSVLLFSGVFAGLGLLVGLVVGLVRGGGGASAVLRGLEAALLAGTGGILSTAFIGLLLKLGGDGAAARLMVGWAFFPWLGAVDTVWALAGASPFTPGVYLWTATAVGAFAGMMDGIWRIHQWSRWGLFGFVSDLTWGLAGTLNGCLFHLYNTLTLVEHGYGPAEERQGAHRYLGGFALKEGFAITQGSVMSGMRMVYPSGTVVDFHPLTPLFRHERIHVMQNRIFGPFFTLTYLAWMPLWFLAGMLAGAVSKRASVGDGIMWYCYYNNPWEVWAYGFGGDRDPAHPLHWSNASVVACAVPFYLAVIGVSGWGIASVWF